MKVLDFGLAKALEDPVTGSESASGISRSPTLSMAATQAGVFLGTAAYMSPEQAKGQPADRRTDIWAFGFVLFEMLSGRQLFGEPTVSETLAAVLRTDLDWDELTQSLPRRVLRVLQRCLERDPRNRLHAIADARIELVDDEHDPLDLVSGPAAGPAVSRKVIWVAFAIALLGLATGAVGWWTRPSSPELPSRLLEIAHGVGLSQAAISPDGARGALVRRGRLFLRDLTASLETEVPGVQDITPRWSLFWSADSRRIGFITWDAIYTAPVAGGPQQLVCEIPESTHLEGVALGATWWQPEIIVFTLDARGL